MGDKFLFGHLLQAIAPRRGNGCRSANHSFGGKEKPRSADSMYKDAFRQL